MVDGVVQLLDGVLGQPEEELAGRLRQLGALIRPHWRNLRDGSRNLSTHIKALLIKTAMYDVIIMKCMYVCMYDKYEDL